MTFQNPNRMEIDPGDIPPSKRPGNPNVDDRTKIPEGVTPHVPLQQPNDSQEKSPGAGKKLA